MGQHRVETISAFSAQKNGQATLCDLTVQCSNCEHDVSFKEKTIMYQMVLSLSDQEAMERVLQAAAQV